MSRTRRVSVSAAGLLLVGGLAACGGSSSGGGDDIVNTTVRPDATVTATSDKAEVTIEGFAFHPGTLVVNKGTKVTWVQEDSIPHNVIGATTSSFIHSPLLKKGASYTATFSTSGTYSYICSIHPNMQGKVIVQ